MDDDMKMYGGKKPQTTQSHLSKVWLFYACGFIFALVQYPACAENLSDPTRPAPVFDTAPSGTEAAPNAPALKLQSVLISPGHKVAIINGETVKLGGMYGTAKVVNISEGGVVLDEGGSLQTLKLFPGVEKKIPQIGEANTPIGKKLPDNKRNAVRKEEQ